MRGYTLGQTRKNAFGSEWTRLAEVNGIQVVCGISRGRRVRLAYSAKHGYRWYGFVRVAATGECLLDVEVPKSIGVKGLLTLAGLIK